MTVVLARYSGLRNMAFDRSNGKGSEDDIDHHRHFRGRTQQPQIFCLLPSWPRTATGHVLIRKFCKCVKFTHDCKGYFRYPFNLVIFRHLGASSKA
jgi:hypothetical protein